MSSIEKFCLSCSFFRLKTVDLGVCKVDKEISKDFPDKSTRDTCSRWRDAGQQYYIRTGWIKAQASKN